MNLEALFGKNLPKFDEGQLKKMLPNLDSNMLEQIKQMARLMGMSESEINKGINDLQKLK